MSGCFRLCGFDSRRSTENIEKFFCYFPLLTKLVENAGAGMQLSIYISFEFRAIQRLTSLAYVRYYT